MQNKTRKLMDLIACLSYLDFTAAQYRAASRQSSTSVTSWTMAIKDTIESNATYAASRATLL